MKLNELNDYQIHQLKIGYYTNIHGNISYGEMADIDELVSMDELEAEYGDVDFVNDDFFE